MGTKQVIYCDQCKKDLEVETNKIIGLTVEPIVIKSLRYIGEQKSGTIAKGFSKGETHYCNADCFNKAMLDLGQRIQDNS